MILFDFINDEAPLFSEGITLLCKKHGFKKNNFAIITMGNRWDSFFKDFNQFSMTDFFEDLDKIKINIDDELKRIGLEYSTQNLFGSDRLLIQYDTKFHKKIVVYTFLFYENICKKNDITHYFTTGIAYMYNLASYAVCKKYNIKHISFYDIRNPYEKRTAVSYDIFNNFNEVNKEYEKYNKEDVTEEMLKKIKDFCTKPAQPTYMNNLTNKQNINFILLREFVIRFKRFYLKRKTPYDYFTRNPFSLSFYKLKKIFLARLISLKEKNIFHTVDMEEDDYFLYPIHMQPEASTLILAPYHVDQLSTIINISKTIPLGTYLYVKEHKSALGERFMSFYNELKKYPNIKLVSHKENIFDLIKNAKGIITLSSTVGWEALFFKKPVIVMGNVFYNSTGLTLRANSYSEVQKLVNDIYLGNYTIKDDFEYKLAFFVNALLSKSYPFEFNVYKMDITERLLNKENIDNFTDCLVFQIKRR